MRHAVSAKGSSRSASPVPGFLELAGQLRAGATLLPLIVVSAAEAGGDVVLEGHVRLTAFALAPEVLPAEVEVLRGVSPDIARWWAY
jgi:hypothetical protein